MFNILPPQYLHNNIIELNLNQHYLRETNRMIINI